MPKPNKIDIDKVLEDISAGMSVVKACKSQGCSSRTFYDLMEQNEEIKQQYTRACEERGYSCTDRIEDYEQQLLNKEIDPATARVLIDTEKWKACKFYPKMFGEKQAVEVSGKDGSPLVMPNITVMCVDEDDGNNNKTA